MDAATVLPGVSWCDQSIGASEPCTGVGQLVHSPLGAVSLGLAPATGGVRWGGGIAPGSAGQGASENDGGVGRGMGPAAAGRRRRRRSCPQLPRWDRSRDGSGGGGSSDKRGAGGPGHLTAVRCGRSRGGSGGARPVNDRVAGRGRSAIANSRSNRGLREDTELSSVKS